MPITGIIQDWGGFGTDEELYGRKVNVPDYPELEEAQRKSTKANRDILPEAQKMVSETNTFNQAEIDRMLRLNIPDLDEINRNVSSTLAAWTRGEPGRAVEDLVSRKTAERSVAGGFAGSGMHHNLEARDLGLTALEMTKRGMDSAERWLASVRSMQTTPMMDITSMFISPAQKFAAMEAKWNRDLYAETMAAAPNPAMRGQWDAEMEMIGMILSVYGGGGGYKNSNEKPPPPPREDGEWNFDTGKTYQPVTFNETVAPQAEKDWKFKLY